MHIKDVLIQFEVNNHVEECLLVALFKRKNINWSPCDPSLENTDWWWEMWWEI